MRSVWGDLLSDIRRDQHERRHYDWAAASVALILIILLVYLTSRYWRRSLLTIASRWAWRQTRVPMGVPAPKPRSTCPSVFSVIDEECAVGTKSPMGHDEAFKEKKTPNPETLIVPPSQPSARATGEIEGDRAATLHTPLGVRYSQPERYQL